MADDKGTGAAKARYTAQSDGHAAHSPVVSLGSEGMKQK